VRLKLARKSGILLVLVLVVVLEILSIA